MKVGLHPASFGGSIPQHQYFCKSQRFSDVVGCVCFVFLYLYLPATNESGNTHVHWNAFWQ